MPVRTPGPTTSGSRAKKRRETSSIRSFSCGTTLESATPEIAGRGVSHSAKSPRSSTPYSSIVRAWSVRMRQCTRSFSPSYSPRSVWVLLTLMASSIRLSPRVAVAEGDLPGHDPRFAAAVGTEAERPVVGEPEDHALGVGTARRHGYPVSGEAGVGVPLASHGRHSVREVPSITRLERREQPADEGRPIDAPSQADLQGRGPGGQLRGEVRR